MSNRSRLSCQVCSILMALFLSAACYGQADLQTILDDHDPNTQDAVVLLPGQNASGTADATAPTVEADNPYIKIMDRLTKIFERLVKILERLTKLADKKKTTPTKTPKTEPTTPSKDPPKTPVPGAGAKGGKALLGWLQASGLKGDALRTAWAIAMRESGGNPKAFNGNSKTGDNSYGLFQINMIGSMGPARRKQFGISSNEELFDPMTNCKAMLKLSGGGKNWGPWGIGPNAYRVSSQLVSAFKKYYDQFPPK